MTTNHTPGPWDVSDSLLINDADCREVAAMALRDDETTDANARLIAAAPELLAALETVFFALGKSGANADTKHVLRAEWLIARAAIAKAKG